MSKEKRAASAAGAAPASEDTSLKRELVEWAVLIAAVTLGTVVLMCVVVGFVR